MRDRVLIIDDDPLFRTILVQILKRDYITSVAADGSEGFYLAIESPPMLAIVDLQMPGWDGFRTLQAFRSHPTLQNIPVLMLTSDTSREAVIAAIRAGADDYVLKTCLSREELLTKLANLRANQTAPQTPAQGSTTGQSTVDLLAAAIDAWE